MVSTLKWMGSITMVLVVFANAFPDIYNVVLPWNLLVGFLGCIMLTTVALVEKDKQYLLLNIPVALFYLTGYLTEIL